MLFSARLTHALHVQKPGYDFIRMFRNSWVVHLWDPQTPNLTACGLKLSNRIVRARSGQGSLCSQCERLLEDLGFTYPTNDLEANHAR